jgi:hypothetical protein
VPSRLRRGDLPRPRGRRRSRGGERRLRGSWSTASRGRARSCRSFATTSGSSAPRGSSRTRPRRAARQGRRRRRSPLAATAGRP